MSQVNDVLDWDEASDPTQAPAKSKPQVPMWHFLPGPEHQLLDALADGTWVPEDVLQNLLGWGLWKFFRITVRMVRLGWIEARPMRSFWSSQYRLGRSFR